MRSRPNAVELIHIAEKTLTGEVATDFSARQRYNVALIASALGISRRELDGGMSAYPGELRELEAMYGRSPHEEPAVALDRLNRRFAADLRAGAFDEKGKKRKAALALLRNDVAARLAEDNPRYQK